MLEQETNLTIRDLILLLNPPESIGAQQTLPHINLSEDMRRLFLSDSSIEAHATARYRAVQTVMKQLRQAGCCPLPPLALKEQAHS